MMALYFVMKCGVFSFPTQKTFPFSPDGSGIPPWRIERTAGKTIPNQPKTWRSKKITIFATTNKIN